MPQQATATFTIQVVPNPLTFSGGGLTAGRVGTAYAPIDVSGNAAQGTPPRSFALAPSSVLPPGLSLSSTGVISGTPTTPGNYSFDIVCTDSGA